MSTSDTEMDSMAPVAAWCDDESLHVKLTDGRQVTTPLSWYPSLLHASHAERNTMDLMYTGIHWPDLDEDLSIRGMLQGWKPPELVEEKGMAETSLKMEIDPDTRIIIAAYETEDDLGKIIRTHFAVEQLIEKIVATQSDAKIDGRTSFFGKVNLLRAMRVPEKLCVACEMLNDLRNQFAHNSQATINNTKSVSDKFLAAVEAFFPGLPKAKGTFVNKKAGAEHSFEYGSADQGQRIVVAASFLLGVLGALPKMYDFSAPAKTIELSGLSL